MANAAREISPCYVMVCTSDNDGRWLDERRSGIGASEIAVVLGASSWESVLDLYYRKIGDEAEKADDEETEAAGEEWLLWGRLLEDSVRTELCRRAGVQIAHRNVLLRSTQHRWALATPDGLTTAGEPVETKNIAWGYDADEWAAQIPEKYYLQCQQQMLVTGARRCLFGALLWGARLIWEWLPRDEAAIRRIIEGGSRFWSLVERREAPMSDGHEGARRLLGKLAVVQNSVEVFEPEIDNELAIYTNANKELAEVRAKERVLKKHRDAAADHIAQHMGAYRRGYTQSGWQFRWETVARAGYSVGPVQFEQFKISSPKHKKG